MESTFETAQERAVLVGLNAACFTKEKTATDESLEELEVLCALGVDYYQGYYIARPDYEPPIPTDQVLDSIRNAYAKKQAQAAEKQ